MTRASTKTRSAQMTEDERRRVVRDADANNLIDGLHRDPSTDDIFNSYIEGRIEASDIVPMLKERFGLAWPGTQA